MKNPFRGQAPSSPSSLPTSGAAKRQRRRPEELVEAGFVPQVRMLCTSCGSPAC